MELKLSTWTRRLLRRPEPPRAPAPAAAPAPTDTAPEAAFEGAADFMVVGRETALGGRLVMDRSIRVEGEFQGSIECSETVVVAPTGSVEGDIRARRIVILGAVVGDVTGKREVSLRALGKLHGEVVTANFELERGAFFVGHTRMLRPQDRGWRRAEALPSSAPGLDALP